MSSPNETVTAIFSVTERVGALDDVLQIFKKHAISLARIESRPSTMKPKYDYDFYVDFYGVVTEKLRSDLGAVSCALRILGSAPNKEGCWFPRKIVDLDMFANRILSYGSELDSDHPGFTDQVYRQRRQMFADIAFKYRFGEKIPFVQYTKEEVDTWTVVYDRLTALYPTHACEQHRKIFPLLEAHCGYGRDKIPQLENVSQFLLSCTGFRLRPVAGLLSSRDFLNGLAFRTFHSTQYIRHHSKPLYTPEPDICHELLGHVPLFADKDFADFSQSIGLASLGASDEFVKELATCYWFTVEFGLCLEKDKLKAYGAGLLSSFGELEHCLSGKSKTLPFQPDITAQTAYPITEYQPLYFIAPSFSAMTRMMRDFAAKSDRPFAVHYDANTQSVEVLDSIEKVLTLIDKTKADLDVVTSALKSLPMSN